MTRTGDREIRSVSGRLPDNPGELARMVLLVVDDKLEPAGLKFSKCSDHAEFTRDLFFLL